MSGVGNDERERRVNPALRARVEDVLASIRTAANQEHWTPEERAHHAGTMTRIMDKVREHALERGRARSSNESDQNE